MPLVIAGIVGSTGAIVHGLLKQRLMVRPIHDFAAGKLSRTIRRLVAGFLHFTTFNWFISGLHFSRCIFIQEGGKTGDGLVSRKLLPVWSSCQPLGDPGPPCGTGVLYAVAVLLILYGFGTPRG